MTYERFREILVESLGRNIDAFRERMRPTLHMLNKEWGVMETRRATGGTVRRYLHYCPSGDIRSARGKECDLCRVQVPEAVQFLAQVLAPSE